jgi:transcriptional regulator with XRE-family HTH domain
MSSEDERLGRLLRLLRRRRGWRQIDLAQVAHVSRRDVLLIEAGRCGQIPLDRVRRAFAAVDARAKTTVWWNGAAADRLLDERHAGLVERALASFRRAGWETAVEVSFSDYGDRGSIDIFAARPRDRAVAITEVKSDIGSIEEMNRMLDTKVRLAPKVAFARLGWRPAVVGRLLVLPSTPTMRRIVQRHSLTMVSAYPARGREIRTWLRSPAAPISGLWFVSEVRHTDFAIAEPD